MCDSRKRPMAAFLAHERAAETIGIGSIAPLKTSDGPRRKYSRGPHGASNGKPQFPFFWGRGFLVCSAARAAPVLYPPSRDEPCYMINHVVAQVNPLSPQSASAFEVHGCGVAHTPERSERTRSIQRAPAHVTFVWQVRARGPRRDSSSGDLVWRARVDLRHTKRARSAVDDLRGSPGHLQPRHAHEKRSFHL